MAKTYAIADLHGRFDLLELALRDIEAGAGGGKVVFLGDYIDRGPQSREVVERLMAGPQKEGWRWICLKGNHEAMMVSALDSPGGDLVSWLSNGGEATLQSYGGEVPEAHLAWCRSLPMWHDDGKRVFVHAGLEPRRPLDAQGEAVLLWMRYDPPDADMPFPDRYIVHGHTPNGDGPRHYPGRTNLDTYAVGTGRLVIAIFDDDIPGAPLGFREIRAG